MRLGDQLQGAKMDCSSQRGGKRTHTCSFDLNMLLHYQWVLCSRGVVATIAPQGAPMVKAYMKTIGQPAQNVTGKALIWMVLHSKQQGRDDNWGGRSGQIKWRWQSMGTFRVSIP